MSGLVDDLRLALAGLPPAARLARLAASLPLSPPLDLTAVDRFARVLARRPEDLPDLHRRLREEKLRQDRVRFERARRRPASTPRGAHERRQALGLSVFGPPERFVRAVLPRHQFAGGVWVQLRTRPDPAGLFLARTRDPGRSVLLLVARPAGFGRRSVAVLRQGDVGPEDALPRLERVLDGVTNHPVCGQGQSAP